MFIIFEKLVFALLFRGCDDDGVLKILTTDQPLIIKLENQLFHVGVQFHKREVHFLMTFHLFCLLLIEPLHQPLLLVEEVVKDAQFGLSDFFEHADL